MSTSHDNLEAFKNRESCKTSATNYTLQCSIPKGGDDHAKYFRSEKYDIVVTNPYDHHGSISRAEWAKKGFEKIDPIYNATAISMTKKTERIREPPLQGPNVIYKLVSKDDVLERIAKEGEDDNVTFEFNVGSHQGPCVMIYNEADTEIGFVAFEFDDEFQQWVVELFQIWKEHRGKRYGTAAVRDVEAMAFARDWPSPSVHCIADSEAFWNRVGWNPSNQNKYRMWFAQGFVSQRQSGNELFSTLSEYESK
eukprot:m.35154 g.35154  ORF g.35154 m.35154 type:complete len:252 (+) comp17093_c0_seq1:90-845(+)